MRKIGIIAVLSLLAVALAAVPALAANPHFIGAPTASDEGTTLNVTGSIAGLGNADIDVEVVALGTATVTCSNPAGNVAPGQDTSVTATGTQTGIEVKNGRAFFDVTTVTPTVPNYPTCPNPKWTATVTDVDFDSYTINVYQPSGSDTLVLSRTFNL